MLKGIGVTSHIAIGNAVVIQSHESLQCNYEKSTIEDEATKLNNAIEKSRTQISKIIQMTDDENAAIISTQLDFLDDPAFNAEAISLIELNGLSAFEAIKNQTKTLYNTFLSYEDDPYLQERSSDIKDVGCRIQSNLLGREQVELSSLAKGTVIVAHDLVPSQTAQLDKNNVSGFIIEIGGKTSHTAIMARSMGIAAVVACAGALTQINDNDRLIIDGTSGVVIVNPACEIEQQYIERIEKLHLYHLSAEEKKHAKLMRSNGVPVLVAANIGTPEEASIAKKNGADAIGLFRTEFLYLNRDFLPNENEQFEAYRQVLEIFKDSQVIIRTLDVGGDKSLPYLNLPGEDNPFLGVRAIRLCLQYQEMFIVQLRALLRASIYGNLKIMFPMISCVNEIHQAKKCIDIAKLQLTNDGIPFSDDIEIGIMIELPAAAMIADVLAKEVDFFSIGTNDLTQYSLAVDRGNATLSALYDEMHLGVLRLIKQAVKAAHTEGIFCGMCGELAGNEDAIPLLTQYNLDEYSVGLEDIGLVKMLLLQQNGICLAE